MPSSVRVREPRGLSAARSRVELMQTASSLSELRTRLSGTLLLPGDDGYGEARLAWNLAIDQRPAAVAIPADVEDVQHIVSAAATIGIGVLAQPNGHSAGRDVADVILIRPQAFDEISIDVESRTARVGAGVSWGAVLSRLEATGLIALAGSNPAINVVAYSLGGGHSMFGRTYGLQAPAITAVELVDASGAVQRITDESDAELMWALRGAGGLFGVATAIEFRLFDGDELYGGKLMFPVDKAPELLTTVFGLAETEPTLGLSFSMMSFPNAPGVPEPLRGTKVASVDALHIGGPASGMPMIEPLREVGTPLSDSMQVFGIESLAAVAAEPVDPMFFEDWSSVSAGFDIQAASALAAAFHDGVAHGLGRLEVRPFGGSLAAGDGARAVAAPVAAPAWVGASVMAPHAAALASVGSAFAPLDAALRGSPVTGNVGTLLDNNDTLANAYDDESITRLRRLKTQRDPDGIIRAARELPH